MEKVEELGKDVVNGLEQGLNQDIEKEDTKSNNKNKGKNKIKVLDEKNQPINEDIEKEDTKSLGIKSQSKTVHNKNLKRAKNGEYYEELSDGIGMWSRTGESFLLKDLNK